MQVQNMHSHQLVLNLNYSSVVNQDMLSSYTGNENLKSHVKQKQSADCESLASNMAKSKVSSGNPQYFGHAWCINAKLKLEVLIKQKAEEGEDLVRGLGTVAAINYTAKGSVQGRKKQPVYLIATQYDTFTVAPSDLDNFDGHIAPEIDACTRRQLDWRKESGKFIHNIAILYCVLSNSFLFLQLSYVKLSKTCRTS